MRLRAFSLLEVVVALAILAFCLVAVLGLMPVGLGDYRWASSCEPAVLLLESIEGDLRAASFGGLAVSQRYGLETPSRGAPVECEFFIDGNGVRTEVADPQSRWRVKLRMHWEQAAVLGHLAISWPAQAQEEAESVETFLAFTKEQP